jgi:predicted metal-binding protein
MSSITLTVCRSCPEGRAGLADLLRGVLGPACTVAETDCMSGCIRPSTLAFRSPGKTAYLFGAITPADLPDLVTFVRLYSASPDGNFADARPLGGLRDKAIARIPG